MKQRIFIILLCCSLIALSGCGVQETFTLYGNNVTVVSNLKDVAYIKDFDVMDCCDEYRSIFVKLLSGKCGGYFQIYDIELYDNTGALIETQAEVSVNWNLYEDLVKVMSEDFDLYVFRDGSLEPVEFTYNDGTVSFTAHADDMFVAVVQSRLCPMPVCAVQECDGSCKSCR